MRNLMLALILAWPGIPVLAGDLPNAALERTLRESFTGATAQQWKERLAQDEVQRLCSIHRNSPPPEIAQRIASLSQRGFKYPADGKLMGDWKEGERLASIGGGGQIGRIQAEHPDEPRGGNCYACHMLARKELAAGNLGPSLAGYGRLHGASPETVKYVYQKIYDAQAFFPCSQMPRFGHNGWLTPEQIAHEVAFLLDPESPVNKD